MSLAVVFPDESVFYKKMGKEVFESEQVAQKNFQIANYFLKEIKLSEVLIYEDYEFEWSEKMKQVAVLITSVSFYEAWKAHYQITPALFAGTGIGFISSLVCAEVIPLTGALQFLFTGHIMGTKIDRSKIKKVMFPDRLLIKDKGAIKRQMKKSLQVPVDKEKMLETFQKSNIDEMIDIGPDNIMYRELKESGCSLRCGFLDDKNDANHILEDFHYQKYHNRFYGVLRILGIIASTKNYAPDDEEACKKIEEAYAFVRALDDELMMEDRTHPPEDGKISFQKEVSMKQYEDCLNILKQNYIYKKTPKAEVAKRTAILERELMIDLHPYFSELLEGNE